MAGARDGAFDRLGLGAYRLGAAVAKVVPGPVADGVASLLGFGFSQGMAARRVVIERNLRRVMGPEASSLAIRRAVQAAFDSYARYYVESFRLPSLSAAEVEAGFSFEGFDHVREGLARGNGVILALPHLGGWEWGGRWLCDRGHRVTVIVEPIEPPELFEWFADLRKDLGMTVVPLGPDAAGAILRALKANEIVCLLSDRDIQGGGVEVEFFGERTTLPPGPATLGLRTGAPVIPCAVYFTRGRDGHHGFIRPPLPSDRQGGLRADVARVTQVLAHELELLIRRAPEQWHLFQPNWPSDPGYGA